MFPLCTRKIEKRSLAGRKNMLWLKGWSIIAFMQQKNILRERSIMKAFGDSKHGIFACFKRFYSVEEPVPVRCRSAFRNRILLANSLIFSDLLAPKTAGWIQKYFQIQKTAPNSIDV